MTANSNPLLADLLAAFGALPPKEKKALASNDRRKAPPPPALPLPQAFASRKTGYRIWKATHRAIQIQKQICKCCGAETSSVKGEFFALENGNAHAVWLRPEGYGIEAPDDLPNVFIDLEDTWVTACAECRSSPLDDLDFYLQPRQLQLGL